MSGVLSKFEAIESRIISYSCPKGAPGRVHSLRLRRCFQSACGRSQSIAQESSQPMTDGRPFTIEGDARILDGFNRPDTLMAQRSEQVLGADHKSIWNRNHQKQLNAYDLNRAWTKRLDVRRLDEYGDVLPLEFPGTFTESTSIPDEGALYSALRLANPHMVLKTLLDIVERDGHYASKLLASIPATTFSEVLRCLDPKHFVDRYANLHKEISPRTAHLLGLPNVHEGGYLRFCGVFLSQVNKIITARAQRYPVSTSDIKYLLRCARATGDTQSAEAIWRSVASISRQDQTKRIMLDAECYNHYLATKCWSDSFNAARRYNLRVVPSNLRLREWSVPPYAFQGHQTGPERGIKAQASQIFRKMVESGVPGNEETFCLMMVAMAREGDLSGISTVLRRVWDIDVEALLKEDESKVPPPRSLPVDSPFYPSEQILFTLAHVYGINNTVPTALRLVDYVSRQYDIQIPGNVWNELLEWTFVLAADRSIRNTETNDEGFKIGKLPPASVSHLWNTMTSEPYNVKPTMEMYNRLITNLIHRSRFREAEQRMEEAYRANLKYVRELSRQVLVYQSTAAHNPIAPQRAQAVNLAHLRVRRNRLYIRRWVRHWIRLGSKAAVWKDTSGTFTAQHLPDFLERWKSFLPVRVKYWIAGGEVSFATGVNAANFRMQRKYANRGNTANLLSKRIILPSKVSNPGMLARRLGQGRLMDR